MAAAPQWSPLPFSFVRAGEVLALGIVLPLVCAMVVVLRVYTRKVQGQDLKADDWLAIPATLGMFGLGACLITGYALGVMGYPTPLPYGSLCDNRSFMSPLIDVTIKIEFAFQICQVLTMGLIKLSVIYFCRRIFIVYKGSSMGWTTKVLITLNFCWTIAFVLVLVFGCKLKPWLHWAPLETEMIAEYCGDLRSPVLAAAISDFILELITLVLPLPSIWGLQVSVGKKLGITGVFLVGILSVVASVIKMAYFIIVLVQPYDAGYDVNQTVTTMLWWGMLQAGLAIIAACLPTVYALRKSMGTKSLQSLRDNLKGSFSWLQTSSKGTSEIKDTPLVVTDNSLPQSSGGSAAELQEVYFAADGKVMLRGATARF
ncbi:hypothetical protein CC78DRAFT_593564 [Lojkania enalia]|uniref:Rhodopsin domain-containing protein n=1 Tax=Lojkania enalia TaxID=147567 RepID=A0A9P4JZT8_9PLEO|nr:hypothetical protein CC78DRAFT_593564 [Didymosphaeria enalia]